jgi:hypothetical protein
MHCNWRDKLGYLAQFRMGWRISNLMPDYTRYRGDIPDWEPWIGFFLRCLKKQKDSLAVRLERERTDQGSEDELSDVARHVLKALRAKERLTIFKMSR